MSVVVLGDLVAAALYLGFQATVQVVVYRQFPVVPAAAFAGYEGEHQRRISYVVGPLFLALIVFTGILLVRRPAGVPLALIATSAALVAVILAVTGLLAVPLHRRLAAGWDAGAWHRLLVVDGLRVAAATANVAVVLWAASST